MQFRMIRKDFASTMIGNLLVKIARYTSAKNGY